MARGGELRGSRDVEQPRRTMGAAVFALSVGIPSSAKLLRQFGPGAAVAYLVLLCFAIGLARRWAAPAWLASMRRRRADSLMVVTLGVLAVAFVFIYPRVTSGSDRDEALDLATREMLAGRFPYSLRSFAAGADHLPGGGNFISPMPGELLLAAPFVWLVGSATWQTFFWLGAFYCAAGALLEARGKALVAIWSMLVAGPAVVHEILTGGDLLANSIWVFVMGALVTRAPDELSGAGAAILLGVGLSSRANFALLVPVVFVVLGQRRGWSVAVRRCAMTVGGFFAVTLPFYLHDPAGFSPLHVVGKLASLDGRFPYLVIVCAVLAAVTGSVALARQPRASDGAVLATCTLVLTVPVVVAVGLACNHLGALGFEKFGWYEIFAMPFGVLAAITLARPTADALRR